MENCEVLDPAEPATYRFLVIGPARCRPAVALFRFEARLFSTIYLLLTDLGAGYAVEAIPLRATPKANRRAFRLGAKSRETEELLPCPPSAD